MKLAPGTNKQIDNKQLANRSMFEVTVVCIAAMCAFGLKTGIRLFTEPAKSAEKYEWAGGIGPIDE